MVVRMTTSERKALLFLAVVGALGMVARVVASPAPVATRADRAALATQIAAVDSARDVAHAHGDSTGRGSVKRRARSPRDTTRRVPRTDTARAPVDLDLADSATLVTLPGIGPALAARIVADRDAHGTFGSLPALQRVRGVGPKLAERLAPRVTFSGVPPPRMR
jgi:competence protein ComEA